MQTDHLSFLSLVCVCGVCVGVWCVCVLCVCGGVCERVCVCVVGE